ncbi:MAG: molybdenum ABC transporter ATP-binding protein [Acidimicrobiia bacterium]|nr:molybdenum ABC transporter ATP-binding protein [Acidimicrobiia bacterium]
MLDVRLQKTLESTSHAPFKLDVRFETGPGILILFGSSGAGKSVTLQSIAGLQTPDQGCIRAGGEVLFDSSRQVNLPVRQRRLGYVFQNLALFPHLNARQNVAYGLAQLDGAERGRRVDGILAKLQIAHLATRTPQTLSGGEQQRVALARALVTQPRMLLLDEPLSALDLPIKHSIVADLQRINQELRIPILYVTHDRSEALSLGERLLLLEAGRIVADGKPLDVLGQPSRETVANLTGVENLFDVSVASRNPERGTLTCDAGGCNLEIPYGDWPAGKQLRIGLRSGDILIAVAAPQGLSAQNILPGRVQRIDAADYEVSVQVLCGVTFNVMLTRTAADTLSLKVGREVWLIFKAHSCHVLGP